MTARPCRYCLAAYPTLFEDGDVTACEYEHRDDPRVYALAAAMARIFQPRPNTDEQIAWFLQDADAVVDDFDPPPAKWRLRNLPNDFSEFDMRFRINDVTYVVQHSDKGEATPVRLSTYRSWQREAEAEAAARPAGALTMVPGNWGVTAAPRVEWLHAAVTENYASPGALANGPMVNDTVTGRAILAILAGRDSHG